MKRLLYLPIFALLLLGGCRTTPEYIPVPYPVPVRYDSIVTKIVRDTVLTYPKQENKVVTSDSSYLKTDLAFSSAKIDSTGKLHHSIENFGFVPGKVIETDTDVKKDSLIIKEVPVPYEVIKTVYVKQKDWIWYIGYGMLYIFGAAFVFLLIKLYLRIRKRTKIV